MPGQSAMRFEEIIAAHARTAHGSPIARYFADPYRFFAWARAEAPVMHVPEIDWWAVARFHDIRAIFRDPETFSCANARESVLPLCLEAREIYESSGMRMEPALVDEVPPTHRHHRRIFGRGLSADRVELLEPRIRTMVSRRIDGFANEGRTELLAELLHPVSARMAFHLLGGDDEDFDLADWPGGMRRVPVWSTEVEAAQVSLMEVVVRLWSYGGKLAEAAMKSPGDNYIGDVVRARRADPSLFTDNYLHNVVFLLQLAASDSLALSLAGGIRALLEDKEPWDRLCADPELIPNAVEEILRLCMPIMTFQRLATRDVQVGGVRIPEGGRIILLLASGNRDEDVFPDGDRLDIDRENARDHLSFGVGTHFCLGAALARLEMKIILEELTARLPHMRLPQGSAPEIFRTFTFRGLKHLTVEWE